MTRLSAPVPLLVAVGLAATEGLLLGVYGVLELFWLASGRVAMGLTTGAFFLIYGLALVGCAVALARLHSWARGPVVLAQLIQLGVAWSFRGGDTTLVAVVLAVVALIALAGVLAPASIEALSGE